MSLEWLDIFVIVVYFIAILIVGIVASLRANTTTATGYFLAGKSTSFIPIGFSTFATNIGAPMFIGLTGSAASLGISPTMFEWHAMFILLLLGWFFIPIYTACGVITTPEYLQKRFGGQRIRLWVTCLYLALTVVSSLAGQLYAGAVFIQEIFEWNLYSSVLLIIAVTSIYTVIGGLTAVIWTDTIQTVVLVVGSVLLASFAVAEVGGWERMESRYMEAAANYTYRDVALYDNRTCGMPNERAFHIFQPATSTTYPWPGMTIGLTILAINYFCTDQLCAQRPLSAKNLTHAKGGLIIAAYLKITAFFFFIIPGLAARALYPDEVACADPDICFALCGNEKGCSNIAYPILVERLLPVGVRGLLMAAVLAALMSSLTSIFNSSSTLFTVDVWKRLRPLATEGELMIVGRVCTLALALLAVAWLPVLQQIQGSSLWDYSQAIGSYVVPPIVMTFVLGMLWPRCTEQGAFAGLVVGLCVGVIRMGLEWSRPAPPCGSTEPNNQFDIVSNVHYLHFAIILAACFVAVAVPVSLLTKPRSPGELRRVTWWTRNEPIEETHVSKDTKINGDVREDNLSNSQTSVNTKLAVSQTSMKEKSETMIVNGHSSPIIEASLEKKIAQGVSDASDAPLSSQKTSRARELFLRLFCGQETSATKHEVTEEERLAILQKMTSIAEKPYWRRMLNIQAVIASAVCFFLLAFWG